MQGVGSVTALAAKLAPTLWSLAVFVVAGAVVYFPGRLLVVPATRRLLDGLGVDETFELPFIKVLHAGFAVLAFIVAVDLSGLASFLAATQAITAAATIAIGFAAQDVLGNFVSGVFIVLDPQYNIGDWIQWNDKEGIIEDISFRVTRVHTFDNELITVPNAELTDNAVVNPVAKDRLRITHDVGIGYDDDIDQARDLLLETARTHADILDRPGPVVRLVELAPSSVVLQTSFWVADPARTDLVRIRSEFAQVVKERFDAADIEMPYPYRQLTGTVATRDVTVDRTDRR